jgi:hypothetical protein
MSKRNEMLYYVQMMTNNLESKHVDKYSIYVFYSYFLTTHEAEFKSVDIGEHNFALSSRQLENHFESFCFVITFLLLGFDWDDNDDLPSNRELAKTLFERVDRNRQRCVLCNQVYAQNPRSGYGNLMKHLGSPIHRNTFHPE